MPVKPQLKKTHKRNLIQELMYMREKQENEAMKVCADQEKLWVVILLLLSMETIAKIMEM